MALIVTGLTPVMTAGLVLATLLFLPLPANLPGQAKVNAASRPTRVYDRDGNLIAQFRRFETNVPTTPEAIPQIMRDAVVAAEDKSFYEHGGVDPRGTLRALVTDLRGREIAQGGSTITQQYVKNAYTGAERTVTRKIREAVIASQLDRQLSKDDILFRYLDQTYFGEGAFGVAAAAVTYFRKPISNVTISEAAMLAGLIPAPSRYNPRANPQGAEEKRVVVLNKLLEENYVTKAQYDEAIPQIVCLAESCTVEGPATLIYPPEQPPTRYPYFVDYVRRHLVEKYGEDLVFRGGLKVTTTIIPSVQQAADEEVTKTLRGTAAPVEMALAAVEPGTGYVQALVGGRDFNAPGGQVNLALGRDGGGTGKQPGSSFKPYVLATAFEQDIPPERRYSGAPHRVAGKKDPIFNYGGARYGVLDLRTATRKSVNTVFTRLIDEVGVKETMDTARSMGLNIPEWEPGKYAESVALGAIEVSPLDMASGFGVFANRGERQSATPIIRIVDPSGKVLEENVDRSPVRVLKETTADNVTAVLQGVLEGGGTAAGKGIGRPAAGKTGTAQDNSNAWFVGYTPNLSTAVWLGRSTDNQPLGRIKGLSAVTGGSFPAATWQAFMKRALANEEVAEFDKPAPIRTVVDLARLKARAGFDVGVKGVPRVVQPGTYVVGSSAPTPGAPTTSTSSTSTTSTTVPVDDDGSGVGGLFNRSGPDP